MSWFNENQATEGAIKERGTADEGWFKPDEAAEVHDRVMKSTNKGSLTHELIAGAAGFEAMKMYLDHQKSQGKKVDYEFTKKMLAGFAAAAVERLIETKGLDYIDKAKAKKEAEAQARSLFDAQAPNQL